MAPGATRLLCWGTPGAAWRLLWVAPGAARLLCWGTPGAAWRLLWVVPGAVLCPHWVALADEAVLLETGC